MESGIFSIVGDHEWLSKDFRPLILFGHSPVPPFEPVVSDKLKLTPDIISCNMVRHWRTMPHAVCRDSRVYCRASAAS